MSDPSVPPVLHAMPAVSAPFVALAATVAIAAVPVAAPPAAEASPSPPDTVSRPAATAFLPPGHWTLEALRRLHSLGLTPWDHDPAMLSLPRGEAAAILAHAREEARERAPDLQRLVAGYAARFAEEYPAASGAGRLTPAGAAPPLEGAAAAGGALAWNRLLARGWSLADSSRRGPVPLEDLTAAVVGLDAALQPSSSLALELRAEGRIGEGPGREMVRAAYVAAHLGDLGLWTGRRAPGWGPGRGGRVLLDRSQPFDGAGIFLTEGVRLPWILEALGPIRFETFVAELDRSGPIVEPWFWAFRGSVAPHPRFRLAMAAATFFGGENNPVPTTLENIFKMVTFELASAPADQRGRFSNGHAAAEAWWRPPLGRFPLSLYGEWGFGDTAGGYFDVPAFTFGARADALPGARWLTVGLEGTYFDPPEPPAHGPTYVTGPFSDNWTREGRLFGHPLGGTGREARLYATVHSADAQLRIRGDAFLRDRGAGNLLVPDREGGSGGLEGRLALRRGSLELQLTGALETSLGSRRDWTRAEASLRLRALLSGK